MEDVGPFVVTGGDGAGVLEPVDGALDLVAAFVDLTVEAGGPAALAAAPFAVGPLVLRFRDRVLDLTSSQVAAVSTGAVCLVAAEVAGPCARASALAAGNADAGEDLDHLWGVTALPGCDEQSHGAASAVACEVDLAGQTAPGPSKSLVGAVVSGRRPFFGTRGFFLRAPAAC